MSTSSTTSQINIRWSTRNNTKTEISTIALTIRGEVEMAEEAVGVEAVVTVVKILTLM